MYCFTIRYIPSFYVYDVPTNKVIVWCLLICSCHTSLSVYSYLQWCRYTFPVGGPKIRYAFILRSTHSSYSITKFLSFMCHPGTDSHFTYWWLAMNGVFWFSFSCFTTAIFRHAFTAYARDILVSGRFAKLSGDRTHTYFVVFSFLFQFSLDFLYFFYSHFIESFFSYILYLCLHICIYFSVFSPASFSLNFSSKFYNFNR
jgi:hypothetical protein